ncbi:hypothetical protein OH77DRAFT_1594419 [Trametes cingulata]|nr:hypothetical protein OH77DRAFT_1594419 [Trametes cingulata]
MMLDSRGYAPENWSDVDLPVMELFFEAARKKFPEIQLGEGNWKAKRTMSAVWFDWKRPKRGSKRGAPSPDTPISLSDAQYTIPADAQPPAAPPPAKRLCAMPDPARQVLPQGSESSESLLKASPSLLSHQIPPQALDVAIPVKVPSTSPTQITSNLVQLPPVSPRALDRIGPTALAPSACSTDQQVQRGAEGIASPQSISAVVQDKGKQRAIDSALFDDDLDHTVVASSIPAPTGTSSASASTTSTSTTAVDPAGATRRYPNPNDESNARKRTKAAAAKPWPPAKDAKQPKWIYGRLWASENPGSTRAQFDAHYSALSATEKKRLSRIHGQARGVKKQSNQPSRGPQNPFDVFPFPSPASGSATPDNARDDGVVDGEGPEDPRHFIGDA